MATNKLTDATIRKAIREVLDAGKRRKESDGDGLYLLIEPRPGATFWRQKYRIGGVEKLLSHGRYPEVSIKRAREKRDDARRLLDRQIDPGVKRKAERRAEKSGPGAVTVGAVAEEWFAHYVEQRDLGQRALAPATVEKLQWLLNLEAYRAKDNRDDAPHVLRPIIDRSIRSITKDDIAGVMSALKRRNRIETAHRMLNALERVFRYALGTGRIENDPVAAFAASADPRDKLPPLRVRNHPSITDPRAVGGLLRAIDTYDGQAVTQAALKLSPYLFVRPIELRAAHWREFDTSGSSPAWRIPAVRMKMRTEHIVPLPKQATAILDELHALTGPDGYVFPSVTDPRRPLSENTITAALRRMGYAGDEMTTHGFRSLASTLLRERGWDGELIERQLAHGVGSEVQRAYDKATMLPQRRKMMQDWADYLDSLKTESQVVAFKARRGR